MATRDGHKGDKWPQEMATRETNGHKGGTHQGRGVSVMDTANTSE